MTVMRTLHAVLCASKSWKDGSLRIILCMYLVNHAFQVHVPLIHLQVKFLMHRTDNTDIHFFCFREEHKSHSPKCEFLLLNKKEEDWTVEDFLELETKRQINRMVRLYIVTYYLEAIDKYLQ